MATETQTLEPTYTTAKGFALTSGFWMMVATFFGLLGATELVAPDLTENIGGVVFGRVRPTHVNLVLFGFVTPGLLSAAFYFIPRLLRTRLFSERLGVFTVVAWNIALVGAVASLAAGFTQGREYAELVWPIDIMVVAAFSLVFYNFIMTVKNRREPILYVSVWYVLAGIILTACTFALGNVIWKPDSGALVGIHDAILLWFYGHNVFGLLLTPLSAAVAYYVIPRACRAPLYSHTLSLLGFWALIVVYTHIGTHHLLQVPVPTWLKVVAIVDSVAMVIPVMAFLINIWYTARGRLGEIHADIGAKFVFTGTIMYFFVSIQGSLMALPEVQRVTHFNNWVVAHAHRRAGLCRHDRPGRALLHHTETVRQTALQPVSGRFPILDGPDRHGRVHRGADHRRPDPGQRLAQRRDRLPRAAGNPRVLRGPRRARSDDLHQCGPGFL